LQAEDKIGTMLPCNVMVQESSDGQVEVTVVDPLASMQAVENSALKEIAAEIIHKLKMVSIGYKVIFTSNPCTRRKINGTW
jgi:uncharacterized protein (DUF302 family)